MGLVLRPSVALNSTNKPCGTFCVELSAVMVISLDVRLTLTYLPSYLLPCSSVTLFHCFTPLTSVYSPSTTDQLLG